jgi:hypothetical protein
MGGMVGGTTTTGGGSGITGGKNALAVGQNTVNGIAVKVEVRNVFAQRFRRDVAMTRPRP